MNQSNHTRSLINNMVGAMRKESKPRINIVDAQRLSNDGYARITASVSHMGDSRADHGLVMASLSETLGAKLRPVAGSFHVLASNKVGDTITGIISANPETVAYDAAEASSFKAVAGNMFMDEEEQLWALRKTEAGDLLVKSRGKDDADIIADLMTSLSSANVGTMAYESVASANKDIGVRSGLQGGDFITFVNPQTETVEFGAVVAGTVDENGRDLGDIAVQTSEASGGPVTIDRNMALGKFDEVEYSDDGLAGTEEATAANAHSLEHIAAYYKRVFQRDPAYFEKFMERWMNHAFS